jgi:hypothetical protein
MGSSGRRYEMAPRPLGRADLARRGDFVLGKGKVGFFSGSGSGCGSGCGCGCGVDAAAVRAAGARAGAEAEGFSGTGVGAGAGAGATGAGATGAGATGAGAVEVSSLSADAEIPPKGGGVVEVTSSRLWREMVCNPSGERGEAAPDVPVPVPREKRLGG